jgi:hypothetical protein
MQTPATDFLLFPSISTESSSDIFSMDPSSQPMLYHSDQLSAVDNLSTMDPYSYNFYDGNYQSLSQNVHPSRAMKSFFNQRSSLHMDSMADMSQGMRYASGPATPPTVPAPQLMDRMPTPFSASNPSITSASTSANGSPYSESWIDNNNGIGMQVNDMFPTDFASAETEMDSEFAISPKFGGSCVGEYTFTLHAPLSL